MATSNQTTENQVETLTCSICLNVFTDPRILPCIHTFCKTCLLSHIQTSSVNNRFLCPICRNDTQLHKGGIDGIKHNFYIKDFLQQFSNKTLCDTHPGEDLRLYCVTCCVRICRDCKFEKHDEHKSRLFADMVEEKIQSLKDKLEIARPQALAARKVLASLKIRETQANTAAESCIKHVEAHVEQMHDNVDSLADELIEQMQTDREWTVANLKTDIKVFTEYITSFNNTETSVSEIASGKDETWDEIFLLHSELEESLNNLHSPNTHHKSVEDATLEYFNGTIDKAALKAMVGTVSHTNTGCWTNEDEKIDQAAAIVLDENGPHDDSSVKCDADEITEQRNHLSKGDIFSIMDAISENRWVAAMVLAGVGDALGFRNGRWECCYSGPTIHRELRELGGVSGIRVKLPGWRVSDDTVMHLATAQALMAARTGCYKEVFSLLAREYKNCWSDMKGRGPGLTFKASIDILEPDKDGGYRIPFNPRGGGCGAAMRAMCIGLMFPAKIDLANLIAISIESGRMTHHHPTGYLGAMTSALFTAYALHGKPIREWGRGLLDTLPMALEYVRESGEYVKENEAAWDYFEKAWVNYINLRGLFGGDSDAVFPHPYGVEERDAFYKSVSFAGWGGSSGHDAPMIAYDALLGAGDDWEELCHRALFHSGDNDSTGTIAACWYGAMYGFNGVPYNNHKHLEYRDRLASAGQYFYNPIQPAMDWGAAGKAHSRRRCRLN